LTAEKRRSVDANDYLEVLSDLAQKYEFMHRPIADASPGEILKSFMEERRINQPELADGSSLSASTLSRILRGRQKLTLDHMQKLATFLDVDVSVFLPASTLKRQFSRK
jgi:HTH-type transcriptional regulator/antitoxin HigA